MRSVRLIVLSLWLGAIVFFGWGVAPNIFSVLSTEQGGIALAGDIVSRTLALLHYFGLGCGILFLIFGIRRFNTTANWLVIVMIVLTCISQFGISRRMRQIRAAAPHESIVVLDERSRAEFDRLHKASTTTEGAILLLGVVALIADARRRPNQ